MTILRAYRTALDPTTAQRKRLARQAGAARWVFNWALGRWREMYEARKEGGPKPNAFAIHRSLTPLKRTDGLSWLGEVSSYVVREAVNDVGTAYTHFHRRLKSGARGKAAGLPQFRSSGGWRARGFRVAQPDAIEVREDSIKIAGVGWVRLHEPGYIPPGANYRGLACRRVGKRWYVAVQIERERDEAAPVRTGQYIAVTCGLGPVVQTSDGHSIGRSDDVDSLRSAERVRKLWERRMARRFKGGRKIQEQSEGWREAARHVAELHARCADIRRDRLHQATTRLVRHARGATIVLPDVRLGRSDARGPETKTASRLALFELRRQIEYKQRWRGAPVVVGTGTSSVVTSFAGGSPSGESGGQAGRRKTAHAAGQRPAEPDQSPTKASVPAWAAPDGGSAVSAALTSLGSGNRADRETSSSEKRAARPRVTGRAVSARQQSISETVRESGEELRKQLSASPGSGDRRCEDP